MSKRIVTINDVTGNVLSEWQGGDEQTLGPVAGRTHLLVTGDASYIGKRWNGTAFEPVVPPPVRTISRLDFARLFTAAEDIAIDDAGVLNKTVRHLQRRLNLATTVNLDHADVVSGTAYLVSQGLLTEARRTAILAGIVP